MKHFKWSSEQRNGNYLNRFFIFCPVVYSEYILLKNLLLASDPLVIVHKSKGITSPNASHNNEENTSGDSSDVERGDTTRVASIPPARVYLPTESPVVQVCCGLHHTIALLQNGDVYTFGSNIYGQLGVGNLIAHSGPMKVKIPGTAIQIAAGSNHSVVLTSKGEVYTFGAYQKGG